MAEPNGKMPNSLGTGGLLEYNPKHKVLICRQCKYAVQKNALGSHLLRHKIYRGERQRLLSSVAGLDLSDHVQPPPAASSPVDGLAIILGFRCTAIGCGHLCASSKRLRRHWSESHSAKDPPAACGHSVSLQTFFRGTRLRYFEVASVEGTVVTKSSDGWTAKQRPAKPTVERGLGTEPGCFKLLSFLTAIQCCADSVLAVYYAAHNVDVTKSASSQAKDHSGDSFDAASSYDAAPTLVKRLQSLPYRMAEALEKPASIEDFTTILAAIDALVECCSRSYASNNARAAWLGMESWLRMLPDRFKDMVFHLVPPALIVVAHWTVLVERAEHHCWFLKGSAARAFRQIASDLPQDSPVQSLIEDLLA